MTFVLISGGTMAIGMTMMLLMFLRERRWRREHPGEPRTNYTPLGWPSQRDLENDPGFVPGWPDVSQTRKSTLHEW